MSYGLYVGRNLTATGRAYLAGYGDEPSSHWLEVTDRATHPEGARVEVGVTPAALMPGQRSSIPQVAETARYLGVGYSHYKGTPAPLTNGGLNEYGVAVRDIWSPSRPELRAMTPPDQTGPNYSDLSRLVLQRARTAREGVDLIAALIARHGHSTYGGNSHIIADADEAWVMIQFAGGRGLWAAERLGPDDIRASRPGWIGAVETDGPGADRFRLSPGLVDFAISQGWHDPAADGPLDLNRVLGDGKGPWDGVRWIEAELRARAARPGRISLHDLFEAVRTPRLTGDTAGYGQVVPLLPADTPAELRLLWHTQTSALAAPFAPVFLGTARIPVAFGPHRYLSAGEAARSYDTRRTAGDPLLPTIPQGHEAMPSASVVFKRLLNLLMLHHAAFLDETLTIWRAHERQLEAAAEIQSRIGAALLAQGQGDLCRAQLSYFSAAELGGALRLAEQVAAGLTARAQTVFGISDDPTPRGPAQTW